MSRLIVKETNEFNFLFYCGWSVKIKKEIFEELGFTGLMDFCFITSYISHYCLNFKDFEIHLLKNENNNFYEVNFFDKLGEHEHFQIEKYSIVLGKIKKIIYEQLQESRKRLREQDFEFDFKQTKTFELLNKIK